MKHMVAKVPQVHGYVSASMVLLMEATVEVEV